MAVTFTKTQAQDGQSFRVEFTSDETTPVPFRVIVDGLEVGAFSSSDGSGSFVVTVGIDESVFLEVLDKACQIPSIAFSGRMRVNWQAVVGATQYRVEEFVSAVWTARATITDRGEGAFEFVSRFLEDVTAHLFRVIPIDAAGNEGSPLTFTSLMVRHPAPPNVGYVYNGAGTPTVTISSV